jgi:uncharacterized membrane protein YoaK (UPF0700 family)
VELREALSQIAEIRARVAAAERFRGYRAAPVALTGLLAILVAALQPRLVPDPTADVPGYLAVWLSAAVVAGAIAGSGIWLRHRYGGDPLAKQLTWLAVGQFAPCLVAGAVVTAVLVRHAPAHAPLLPGLWQVLFSLGVFASFRLLPRAVVVVGVFYLLAGAFNLTRSSGPDALSPWVMGGPFAVGQLLTAGVLYWNLERTRHDPE